MDQAWSATRARTFQDCRRKYYYRYHLAPLGKAPDSHPDAREAHRVKDLIGIEAWAGELVHDLLQQILARWRSGRDFPEAEMLHVARLMLSRRFRASQEYWDAHPDQFARRPTLLDMHYFGDGEVSREKAAALKALVTGSLQGFLRSELASRIRSVGSRNWLPIDRNAAARLDNGLLILVKPDFAFRDGDRLHILDWKTGKPDPYWETIQVTCYALYAAEKWRCSLNAIRPAIVHLYPEFGLSDADYGPERIRDIQQIILETQDEITVSLRDATRPVEERFPLCEDGRRCRWCQFRRLCDGGSRLAVRE